MAEEPEEEQHFLAKLLHFVLYHGGSGSPQITRHPVETHWSPSPDSPGSLKYGLSPFFSCWHEPSVRVLVRKSLAVSQCMASASRMLTAHDLGESATWLLLSCTQSLLDFIFWSVGCTAELTTAPAMGGQRVFSPDRTF